MVDYCIDVHSHTGSVTPPHHVYELLPAAGGTVQFVTDRLVPLPPGSVRTGHYSVFIWGRNLDNMEVIWNAYLAAPGLKGWMNKTVKQRTLNGERIEEIL